MRYIKQLTITLFFIILILPLLQMYGNIFERVKLTGATVLPKKPEFTFVTYSNGTFQKEIKDWLDYYIGFKGYAVKTENQLNFSLFHDISSKSKSKIILGKDGYLFEKNYIDDVNNLTYVSDVQLEHIAKKIKTFQNILAKKDIDTLLLLSPSKASLYKKNIPQKYIDVRQKQVETNHKRLLPYLDKHNVVYVNSHKILKDKKAQTGHETFAKGGTHWNYYGVCIVASEMVNKLELISNKNYTNVDCSNVFFDDVQYGYNRDLLDLINIWQDDVFNTSTPYVRVTPANDKKTIQPNVLFVGDSFLWQLTTMLRQAGVYTNEDLYYYFNTKYTQPGNVITDVDRTNFDIQHEVYTKDVVIIEGTETAIGDLGLGFGFIEKVLAGQVDF